MSEQPVCLIPARGGSKRFPRKNIAMLAGKPLLGWTIEAVVSASVFGAVVVSTEDDEIAGIARQHGAEVGRRSPELATDTATVVQVTLDFVRQRGNPEVACVILPTAAMLQPDDLRGALQAMTSDVDYVMSVTRYMEPPFWALHYSDGYLKPVWPDLMKKSQELPDTWVDCGYFYFARVAALQRERSFYGARLKGYPIPRLRSVDIDVPEDLEIAEAFLEVNRARAARPVGGARA